MKKPWFKAKDYGWGWYPARWQGWLVLAAWALGLVCSFQGIDANSHSVSDTLINFFPRLIILTGVLIWICAKTGERPSWRWRPGEGSRRGTSAGIASGRPASPGAILGWTFVVLALFVGSMYLMKFIFLHLR